MKRGKRTLTKKTVDALKTPGWYGDRDLPGFALRVLPSGSKMYVVRCQPRGLRVRRYIPLGAHGVLTIQQAREKARQLLSAASLGDDPVRPRCPSWGDWSVTYFDRLTAKSKDVFHRRFLGFTDEINRRTRTPTLTDPAFREIRFRWAARSLDVFTPNDVETERQGLRTAGKSKTTINRWLAVVGACFQAAVRAEIIERNPVAKVKADREAPPRSRTLTREEMGRLLAALEHEEDRHAAVGVLLAVLTGARRGEILSLRWKDVHLDEGFARLPDSKSGRPRYLPLPPQAVDALRTLPKTSRFVVSPCSPPDPETGEEKPRPDLKSPWERLIRAAGIEGASFHDLRRTFGQELNRAAGLRVTQEALGHTTPEQTASAYTPEGFDAVKEAATARANLLPFPKRAAG